LTTQLLSRLAALQGKEEFEEEHAYFQEIQRICFGSRRDRKEGDNPDR
jgi:hypothetical protein